MKRLARFTSEGFVSDWWQETDGRVFGPGDADIDADGANGQFGKKPAYNITDTGSELLANGGMRRRNGRVEFAHSWGKNIVIVDPVTGRPRVFPGGLIASKTAYRFPGMASDDPKAYVDSETVPYVVVSPVIRMLARGVVMGCRARMTFRDRVVDCVVADIGPRAKIGECSIAAARALGINPSPRVGGESRMLIDYELWPGEPAILDGVVYPLIPA